MVVSSKSKSDVPAQRDGVRWCEATRVSVLAGEAIAESLKKTSFNNDCTIIGERV